MSHSKSLALLLGLSLVSLAWGDASARKGTSGPSVEQLIEQLSSKDYQVREKACKAIAGLGKEALPALIKARANRDPEVRRRLDEVIPPLERAVALSPRLVTLHMTNKPVGDVINELNKQTGYKILTWPDQQPNVTPVKDKVVYSFHFDKLPFWLAMDKICDATGMTLQQNYWGWGGGDDALRLYRQDVYVPFVCYSGPFKVIATSFNYSRNNNFGQLPKNPGAAANQANEFLNVTLQIATEPRMPLLRVGQVKLAVAEDDEGHSMLPRTDVNPNNPFGRMYFGGYYRGFMQQTQAALVWPSKTSRTVKLLKGAIPVTLLADQTRTVVTDKILASKGKKYKVGDATFQIEDITEMPGKQYQIKINVTETSKEAQHDYSRIQSVGQRLELQDDKGNKIAAYANATNFMSPSNAQFTIMTQQVGGAKTGPPAKLVYSSWILMDHEVAFEFKNLPLP
jgi:hypothetical protein